MCHLKDDGLGNEFKEKVLNEIKLSEDVEERWKVNTSIIKKIGEQLLGKTYGIIVIAKKSNYNIQKSDLVWNLLKN